MTRPARARRPRRDRRGLGELRLDLSQAPVGDRLVRGGVQESPEGVAGGDEIAAVGEALHEVAGERRLIGLEASGFGEVGGRA